MASKTRIPSDDILINTLQERFGLNDFRPLQRDIIKSILAGADTFALLPTGGGKSLCYQLPSLLLPGITLVISPLIALMRDQVEGLKKKGIPSAAITSAEPLSEKEMIMRRVKEGKIKILYVSPERLANSVFVKTLSRLEISLLVVDEAHCVTEWGDGFRPEYRRVSSFIEKLPHRPVTAAFTATASPGAISDIASSLKMRDPRIFRASFDRPNLFFETVRCRNKPEELLKILPRIYSLFAGKGKTAPCGIIYCMTRKETAALASFLTHNGYESAYYHAGLSNEKRASVQAGFIDGKVPLLTATNAFGMGIDKPDVRFVIHYGIPSSPERYMQEAGRAGRDGLPSYCLLMSDAKDHITGRKLLKENRKTVPAGNAEKAFLEMETYAKGNSCLREQLLSYFGEKPKGPCMSCGFCRGRSIRIVPKADTVYDLLRSVRKEQAERLRIKQSRIFTDHQLRLIAESRPVTMSGLSSIEGIPLLKALIFGRPLLDAVRSLL